MQTSLRTFQNDLVIGTCVLHAHCVALLSIIPGRQVHFSVSTNMCVHVSGMFALHGSSWLHAYIGAPVCLQRWVGNAAGAEMDGGSVQQQAQWHPGR